LIQRTEQEPSTDLTPGHATGPERLYINWFLHFLARARKQKQKKTPVSSLTMRVVQSADDVASRAAMRRCPALREFSSLYAYFGEFQSRSGAHNLAIAARLASPDALPGSTILAASAN